MKARIFLSIVVTFLLLFLPFSNLFAQNNGYTELLLDVTLNRVHSEQIAHVLEDQQGHLWVDAHVLSVWNIKRQKMRAVFFNGDKYYFIDDIPGVKYRIDLSHLRLDVDIPAHYLKPSHISIYHDDFIVPQRSPLGGFMNYDFFAQKVTNDQKITNGLFEFGIFNNFGVITSEVLGKNMGQSDNRTIRLNSTWTIDKPEVMRTWRMGDAVNRPGLWGRSVSFGGVQLATNFATQPSFITFPLPAVSGTALMPSTADVYINNALSKHQSVPGGAFDISNIPVVTGAGDIQLVTTDVLGRQQVVTVPYYASQELLRPGLHDFSFEAGFTRKDYGVKSNEYGQYIVVGTDTFGINNNFTGQIHGEWFGSNQALGVGSNYLFDHYGVLTTAFAGSHDKDSKFGGLLLVQFTHQGRKLNYGLRGQWTTHDFTQVGLNGDLPPISEGQLFIGFPLGRHSTFSMSYTGRHERKEEDKRFLTANYNLTIRKNLFLNVSAQTNVGGKDNKAIFLNLVANFGNQTTGVLSAKREQDHNQYSVALQRSLPPGSGYGYNFKAATGKNKYIRGGVSLQSGFGTYSAQIARQNGDTNYQLEASGGVAVLNKDLFASRKITQSFAVVNVDGYKDIPVYLENHPVGKTNRHGNAFVPNILAYHENHLSVNPDELPLDAIVDNDEYKIVPYYRSGIVVRLPIKPNYGGLVTVKLLSGKMLPIGTELKVVGQKEPFIVANDGQAYLTGLSVHNHVVANWDHQHCEFNISYTPSHDPVPNLGSVICR